MYHLAFFYKDGIGGLKQSCEEAERYFIRSAQLGRTDAVLELSLLASDCSLQILKVDRVTILRTAANGNNARAQLEMARVAQEGDWGTKVNFREARDWYQRVIANPRASDSQRSSAQDALKELDEM
jgi:hypothetical protein